MHSTHCLAPFPLYPRPKDEATPTNLVVSNGQILNNHSTWKNNRGNSCGIGTKNNFQAKRQLQTIELSLIELTTINNMSNYCRFRMSS